MNQLINRIIYEYSEFYCVFYFMNEFYNLTLFYDNLNYVTSNVLYFYSLIFLHNICVFLLLYLIVNLLLTKQPNLIFLQQSIEIFFK